MSDQTLYESIELQGDPADQIIIGFKPDLGLLDPEQRRSIIDAAVNQLSKDFGTPLLPEPFIAAPPERKDVFFAIMVIRLKPGTHPGGAAGRDQEGHLSGRRMGRAQRIRQARWLQRPSVLAAMGAGRARGDGSLDYLAVAAVPATILGIVNSGLRRPGGGLHADLGRVEPVAVCQPPLFFQQRHRPGGPWHLPGRHDGSRAQNSGSATGIASPIDPAWNIRLLPVQFFSPRVPPRPLYAAIGIVWAALRSAKVINASWHVASGGGAVTTLSDAVVFAKAFDCLIVFAAGNDGTDNEIYPTYPANFGSDAAFAGNVLTVAASDRHDARLFSRITGGTPSISPPRACAS